MGHTVLFKASVHVCQHGRTYPVGLTFLNIVSLLSYFIKIIDFKLFVTSQVVIAETGTATDQNKEKGKLLNNFHLIHKADSL